MESSIHWAVRSQVACSGGRDHDASLCLNEGAEERPVRLKALFAHDCRPELQETRFLISRVFLRLFLDSHSVIISVKSSFFETPEGISSGRWVRLGRSAL